MRLERNVAREKEGGLWLLLLLLLLLRGWRVSRIRRVSGGGGRGFGDVLVEIFRGGGFRGRRWREE